MNSTINIVWLKRDLRLQDHAPFDAAELASEDYRIIYVFEPLLIQRPDCSLRHLQFIYNSLLELQEKLNPYGRTIEIFYGELIEIMEFLKQKHVINQLFSHQESGVQQTWDRDKLMMRFCKKHDIKWKEFQRDGILRGIKTRSGWDNKWFGYMHSQIIKNTYSSSHLKPLEHAFQIPEKLSQSWQDISSIFQKPGENFGWKYLISFCKERGKNYHRLISKPLESRSSCGRISPYLAWGNLSIRQCYQFVKSHQNYDLNKRAFNGLVTRLRWHCHFIQKFENQCNYETLCLNPGYESLEHTNNEDYINAWKNGTTGFPMVDACMRCLQATGWINFRMRAMLVSFLCFQLDCDWRKGVYHLARLFLDYEPGIHYTQFQMQAGTTGINTVRMYNPIKQSQDHDPKGIFIKKWIPELENVPEQFIHEPWNMTSMDKTFYEVSSLYPEPIVDFTTASKAARTKIWGHKKHPDVKKENKRIIELHTRNNAAKAKRKKTS